MALGMNEWMNLTAISTNIPLLGLPGLRAHCMTDILSELIIHKVAINTASYVHTHVVWFPAKARALKSGCRSGIDARTHGTRTCTNHDFVLEVLKAVDISIARIAILSPTTQLWVGVIQQSRVHRCPSSHRDP